MRVALVTPYSPFGPHDHAANDMGRELAKVIAEHNDLHVVTPSAGSRSEMERAAEAGCTLWPLSYPNAPKSVAALGLRPYWLRHSWSRGMTTAALDVGRRI